MIAHCDECHAPFDSREGGACCSLCGRTFCPSCEEVAIHESSRTAISDVCKVCMAAITPQNTKGAVAA